MPPLVNLCISFNRKQTNNSVGGSPADQESILGFDRTAGILNLILKLEWEK